MQIKKGTLLNGKKAEFLTSDGTIAIFAAAENIFRCVYTRKTELFSGSPLEIEKREGAALKLEERGDVYRISTDRVLLEVRKQDGIFTWKNKKTGNLLFQEGGKTLEETPLMEYTTGEETPVIKRVQTVDGERNFVENLKAQAHHTVYRGKLYFQWEDKESIHGLGQGEEGIYNYRGNVQYLYQHNMRIPVPFLISSRGYGVLADCGSLMTFNDDCRGSYLYMDAIEQMDYYVIVGETPDEIVSGYRSLTGKAVMLPKWAYGYVQSKEAYRTQDEVVEIARKYRELGMGLDCVVQDWNTWEDGKWGNKKVDKTRYPNLKEMNDALHEMNVHSMVSVWPNVNSGTENYEEMAEKGFLYYDFATYDAFREEARALYWKQAEEELFSGGFDSWWCDSTEPFSGPDWNGGIQREPWERFVLVGNEHKKFLRADRANLYAAAHAKGIFENQRKADRNKRVLNLTRSGYAGSQKYGTMLWSGDTCATWENFRKQITEGLNMCLSGMPYWTLDIGAFFTVKDKWQNRGCGCNTDSSPKWFWQGDYEDGVNDLGYRELYVRWFQYGAFLPMFRSHGTDTPREIWNFGKPGEMFYDALAETIRLRYRLIPYIYSLAGRVYTEDYTMLRSLLFDFGEDETAAGLDSEFMFGDSLLICPVTEPMYYEKESKSLDKAKQWKCYLPSGEQWVDFYTGEVFGGGQWVTAKADISHIPVFVRQGAVLPMEQELLYAQQKADTPLEIRVYPGKDGAFVFYEDAGDDYGYENGIFNRIPMVWKDKEQTLTIGKSEHTFEPGIAGRKCRLLVGDRVREFTYTGSETVISMQES